MGSHFLGCTRRQFGHFTCSLFLALLCNSIGIAQETPVAAQPMGPMSLEATALDEVEQGVAELDKRIGPLADDVRALTDQLTKLQPPPVNPPEKEESKGPLQVQFRPPMLRDASNLEALFLVIEDRRITPVLPGLDDLAKQVEAHAVSVMLPQLSVGATSTQTLTIPDGAFDVGCEVSRTSADGGTLRQWLERKAGQPGESLDQFDRAESIVRAAILNLDPKKTTLQCGVYPDSFELYRKVRTLAWERKIGVNWEPILASEPVRFGAGGRGVME